MLTYTKYNDTVNEMSENIAALLYMVENERTVTEEELIEGVGSVLGKAGLSLHRNKGLIDYAKEFTRGAGQLILAAIKGDKKKIKNIASKIKREDVIDFLLKLDMATLHIVMGPIHVIDAVTGWELHANIKGIARNAKGFVGAFHDAIQRVKEQIMKLTKDIKRKKMLKHLAIIDLSIARTAV